MDSLKELYKIGNGPSSSHTMGPQKAATIFKERTPDAKSYRVTLYGSLAATGKGHLTDWVISFDQVVVTLAETGRDLKCGYRETSLAGLAKHKLNY